MHSSFLQFGHIHIPIYGIFAALGLMPALALTQVTAPYARLTPEAAWNTGMTSILSAFVISRLLLIAFNLHSFLQYPLLVLALPSLTATGILLTALFLLGYIRWRRLPLLPLLDAFAPCAALLWAFLSLGLHFEGTRDGMPAHLLWSPLKITVHPVELYTFLAASCICFILLRTIRRQAAAAGRTTTLALILSGLGLFFLDFFRLPSDMLEHSWLDPSQIIGTAMILIGVALYVTAHRLPRPTNNE